jgi:hypothetical protein
MMVRSSWLGSGLALAVGLALFGAPQARAEEPARWTPDVAEREQSIREGRGDRNSHTAGVRFGVYGGDGGD